MLDSTGQDAISDIAIVGMALRVPGARNVGEFWRNLREGVESIRSLTPDELMQAGEAPDRLHHPHYVRRTADLPGMDQFDADFFGLSPKDAAIMDPQHRQFLECAWEAMEDANRTPDRNSGPVGVFAGCGMGSYFYFNVCSNRQLVDQIGMFLLRHTGNDKDFLSTRASFTFNLRGPSVNVQTACSTSLVAIHYASQSLLNGECDMALAGGVTIEFPHGRGYLYQEGEILSPDGHCRAFDHRAAGTVFGSGVGVVVLRRLADALADGDIIHAVIKSSAINNDGGNKAGYLAPSVTGQAEAIIEAQALGGISADSIQYVECHGTGTAIGDPIEIEALTQAFRQSTKRTGFCYVGSVKTNIGHLDTAAGVVGVIKAALAVRHGEIPPTLGFEKPNPAIDFAASPFLVADRLAAWPAGGGPRRAAVNSLGVGGTNAHVILEQPPVRQAGLVAAQEPLLLFLSARQRKAVEQAATRLASALSDQPGLALGDVAHTLFSGRRHFEHRMVLAAASGEEAVAILSDPKSKRAFFHVPVEANAGAVFLFPGGGVQHPGMARCLYRDDAAFRATIDEGLSYLPAAAAEEIRGVWLGSGGEDAGRAFQRPSVQLPAILILEVALARAWMSWGVVPAALHGHSMGENAAACIAGVMSFRDAVHLVRLRGELFDSVEPGGMLSVPMDHESLLALLPPELDVASVNAPGLCVVSGRNRDLDRFRTRLEERGVDATRIPIDIAAHSRMLEPILPRFEAFLRGLSLRAPEIPIVSNRSGGWLTAEEATDPAYWVDHLRSTVLFAKGMETLAKSAPYIYIEAGPGRVLSSLAKAQGSIEANQIINSLPHPDEEWDDRRHFLCALGRGWATGLPVAVSRLWEGGRPSFVTLPAYPFQHRRYFIERASGADERREDEKAVTREPDMARWGYRPAWKQALVDYVSGAEATPRSWLFFLDEAGVGMQLATRLRGLGHRVVTVSLGDAFFRHDGDHYVLCAEAGKAGYDALVSALAADDALPSRIVHMWLLTETESFRPGSNFFHRNQECGFYSLLHLAQALGDVARAEDLHVTVVANGMQRVFDEALAYPEKATVLGPALVIPREMPGTTVKLVDVQLDKPVAARRFAERWRRSPAPAEPGGQRQALTDTLWEDLLSRPASEVVAYRKGRRWLRFHDRLALEGGADGAALFREKGVYLFTGGLGDLAFVIENELAARFRARLVLVGRTALPPREEWQAYDRLHGHDAVRRATSAIRRLEAQGAEVLYLSGDVTNPQEMDDIVAATLAQYGEINGVFHAAGIVDDGLIQGKSQEGIERVLAPKVLGTTVLDAALEAVALDFVLLFSSTSTDTAPAGQVDYVAANAYLNAYAESRSQRTDRRTIALHWGIWNEVGIAARASSAAARESIVLPVDAATKGPFFERWVEDEDGVPWLEAVVGPQTHWVLDEHRLVSGQSVMPGAAYIDLVAQSAREYGLSFSADVTELVFLRPLVVADGETRVVRLRHAAARDGYRITLSAARADGGFEKIVEAHLRFRDEAAPAVRDVAPVVARCGRWQTARPGSSLRAAQEDHIRFGPRWGVLKSVAYGDGEALAELELPADYRHDSADGVLVHPAMLDLATGFAMELIAGYDPAAVLWAPAAYGHVSLFKPLPSRILSWVRLADSSDFGEGYAAFDVTIVAPDGEVLLDIRRFVVRRLDHDLSFADPPALAEAPAAVAGTRRPPPSPAMLKLDAMVHQGIRPGEGFEALVRALATAEVQPIVSSIDLDALCRHAAMSAEEAPSRSIGFERPDLESEYIAPRNPVEETLAGYWRELLGVGQVGVHDSFFDMGGHSLIAVRLFRMIKAQYGLDLPISTLFEAPTIALCADLVLAQVPQANGAVDEAAIAIDAPPPQAKPTHVVLMHPGRDSRATPLFICAGMFGNVLNLRHLAQILGGDRPVYGLQARGLYGGLDPHETFEDMARDYIAEIRTVQPSGPYLLAGYSGGGIVAYEIAHQLSALDEEVAHLVMLDTPLPTQPPLGLQDRILMKLQDIRRHKGAFVQKWLHDRRCWEAEKREKRLAQARDTAPDQFNNSRIESAFLRALQRYELKPYAGAVTLLRPKPVVHYRLTGGRRLQKSRNILLDDNGWTPHIPNLCVHEVPGDHDSMVLEPYVRVLAERVLTAIRVAAPVVDLVRRDEKICEMPVHVRQQRLVEPA
ncbi:type I polyketide synthase [Shinella sp. NM-101]|uniref:type I polyketide synthase n=1 Tax=Shinella sp. NM-101 TaxID=2744455 RepID=UPI001F2FC1DF|nr:type I polyketide synthase [Shinella sp. NM-101]